MGSSYDEVHGKAKFVAWDEVEDELREIECAVPDGATPRQALVLADDALAEQGADETGTYAKKVRQIGDVFVLDAKFGRDKATRIYWCPEGDVAQARKAAKKDVKKFWKEYGE